MGKVRSFFKESIVELKKVVWPSRESATGSTKVVLISTVLFAAFFGLVDFLLVKLMYLIF